MRPAPGEGAALNPFQVMQFGDAPGPAVGQRIKDGVALFDVMDKNVMKCDDGEIVSFDVIPIQCTGVFLEMMHAAVKRMWGDPV